jgi:hypothetical protein
MLDKLLTAAKVQFKREKAGEVTIFSEKRHIWLRVTAEDFEQRWKEV